MTMLPYPVIPLIIQFTITVLVLGFISSSSFLRPALLPIIAACSAACVSACSASQLGSAWSALVGGYSMTYLFQYVSLALLSRCSFEKDGPTSSKFSQHNVDKGAVERRKHEDETLAPSQILWMRFYFGVSAACSFRWTGTKRQVKNVPQFSTCDPDYIPSRSEFLGGAATRIMVCYLVVDLLGLGNDEEMNVLHFSPAKIPFFTRLGEVTLLELSMRVAATFGAGVGIYCCQMGLQSIIAFVAVGVGLSDGRMWPPRFGPLVEAYSIRRFWG